MSHRFGFGFGGIAFSGMVWNKHTEHVYCILYNVSVMFFMERKYDYELFHKNELVYIWPWNWFPKIIRRRKTTVGHILSNVYKYVSPEEKEAMRRKRKPFSIVFFMSVLRLAVAATAAVAAVQLFVSTWHNERWMAYAIDIGMEYYCLAAVVRCVLFFFRFF